MAYFLTGMVMLAILLVFTLAFVQSSPAAIAGFLRRLLPLLLILVGGTLLAVGRAGLGLPLFGMGVMWWLRNRRVQNIGPRSSQSSTVRSVWLEMKLDHDTGDLEGLILAGSREGEELANLSFEELIDLSTELGDDAESLALLEAYLDSRFSGWRDGADTGSANRHGSPSSSGPMTKQEAYQVLGLEAGASANEIRSAHRKLMKAVHPDSGGSTFLASRINQAKDTLLD